MIMKVTRSRSDVGFRCGRGRPNYENRTMKAANRTADSANNDCLRLMMERGCAIPALFGKIELPRLFPVMIDGDRTAHKEITVSSLSLSLSLSLFSPSMSVLRSVNRTKTLLCFFWHGNWKSTNLTARTTDEDEDDHKCHRLPSVIERRPTERTNGQFVESVSVKPPLGSEGQMTSIIR